MNANTDAEERLLKTLFQSYHTCSRRRCVRPAEALAICYRCDVSETLCSPHRGDLSADGVVIFSIACRHICLVSMTEFVPIN